MKKIRAIMVFGRSYIDVTIDSSMSQSEMIDFSLSTSNVEDVLDELLVELDELLGGKYSDDDIDNLWKKTGAGVVYVGGGVTRKILETTRARVRKKLRS